jgi:hypothetical protein
MFVMVLNVLDTCFKCFIWFQTCVASVASGYFKSKSGVTHGILAAYEREHGPRSRSHVSEISTFRERFPRYKNDIPSSRSRDGNENRNMAAKHGDVRGKREEAPAIPTGVGPWVGARKAGTAGRGV